MNYLFTAAGEGTRFKNSGIEISKPLIKVFGKELLIWSLESFRYNKEDLIFIITQKKDRIKEILNSKVKQKYKDIDIKWIEINELTNGQLITAMIATKQCDIKGEILIHNCDTYHNAKDINYSQLLNDGFFGIIPCFEAKGEHWSFVEIDKESNKAIRVTEKIRISSNCSVGTYIFKDANLFFKMAQSYIKDADSNNEYYIAPFYQYAIDNNLQVKICRASEVKVYGTPAELFRTFKINKAELLLENS